MMLSIWYLHQQHAYDWTDIKMVYEEYDENCYALSSYNTVQKIHNNL